MDFKAQFEKTNMLHTTVKKIAAEELRFIVEAVPEKHREERELAEGRHIAACEFLAGITTFFVGYKSLSEGSPNMPALFHALNDLAFGFETNMFYGTFKGYLHPIFMNAINTWLDSVEYATEQLQTDTQTGRYMVFLSQHAWLELFPAVAFCLGGSNAARTVGKKLKDRIYQAI